MKTEEYIQKLELTEHLRPETIVKLYLAKKVVELQNNFRAKGYGLSSQSNLDRTSYYLNCKKLNWGTRLSTHKTTITCDYGAGKIDPHSYIDYSFQQAMTFLNRH